MKENRAAHLLGFLYERASEETRSRLGELFQAAVRRSESFQNLLKRGNNTVFMGHEGQNRQAEMDRLLKQAITQTADISRNLELLDQMTRTIDQDLEEAERKLHSPAFFDDEIPVVLKKDFGTYHAFYQSMAGAICYYLVSQFGPSAITGLHYDPAAGLPELIRLVNGEYANVLLGSDKNAQPRAWRIVQRPFYGDNMLEFNGYALEYPDASLVNLRNQAEEGKYLQVTPNCFADAVSSSAMLLTGVGNLVGVAPTKGWKLLEGGVITEFRARPFYAEKPLGTELPELLEKALDTDCYCISPEELVRILNRAAMNAAILERERLGQCQLCGKERAEGSQLVCPNHFKLL